MQQTHPVIFVGAGPGDPELLTLKALRALQSADCVLHDHLISRDILALIPVPAQVIAVGKQGYGPATPQAAIDACLVDRARSGARVVRLKGGDPAIFARLDEELTALEAAGVPYAIVPGITAASAAAAAIGQPLTRRGHSRALRIVTAHDMQGYAEQDWHGLARPGATAAIYMGRRAARFVQGRLMMHGANPATPVTAVIRASTPDESRIATVLAALPRALASAPEGPTILLYGIAPRHAEAALPQTQEIR